MATITAAQSGNFSASSTWTGGTKPGAGDTGDCGAYDVEIDENVSCTELTTTGAGSFTMASAFSITANIVSGTGATDYVLKVSASSGTVAITGDVTAGVFGAILKGGASALSVDGDVTGGSAASRPGINFQSNGGTCNITGTVSAGSLGNGVTATNGCTVTLTGTAVGGSSAYGIQNNGTLNTCITHADIAQGGLLLPGLYSSNANGVTTFGVSLCNSTSGHPGHGGYCKMVYAPTTGYVRVLRADTGAELDLSNDYPAIADVKKDVVYKLTTLTGTLEGGTCDYPAEADVRSGVDYDSANYTGTLDLPAEADVKDSVTYDGATKTGTYDPLSAAVFPAEANTLEAESAYGPTGAEYAGTYHAPDAAEVIDSAVFGPNSGTAGTYDTTGDAPTAEEIATAVWAAVREDNDTAGSFGAVTEWASTGGLDAAGVRTAIGLATANLDTQLGTLATSAELATDAEIATAAAAAILVTPANKLETDASGYVKITGTKNTLDSLNDITVADIIAGITEGTLDLQEMLRIILAAVAGKASGGGTATIKFRDQADTLDRITATVDANGNRTAVTVDGS